MIETQSNNGVRRLAALTAGLTLVLILAGGFVTTTRTGDTIPTWPQSWGYFRGGAWVELTHRLVAGAVGLLIAAVAVKLHLHEPRRWVVRIGWIGFALVALQALLGGMRVHLIAPVAVAIIHACFGQVVFCTMVAVALFVSETWTRTPIDDATSGARHIGAVATLFAFLQLVAGAITRHTGAGLVVHLVGAGAVLLFATLFTSRLMLTPLKRGAHLVMAVLGVQILLGVATWAITAGGFVRSHESPVFSIVIISAHVAVGASLLASLLGVTLMCRRGPAPAPVAMEAARA